MINLFRFDDWEYVFVMGGSGVLKFNKIYSIGKVGTIFHQRFDDLMSVLLLVNTATGEEPLPEELLIFDLNIVCVIWNLEGKDLLVHFLVCF